MEVSVWCCDSWTSVGMDRVTAFSEARTLRSGLGSHALTQGNRIPAPGRPFVLLPLPKASTSSKSKSPHFLQEFGLFGVNTTSLFLS